MSLAEPDSFPSSNTPNSFFRQHHEVEAPEISAGAFRPAWRVRTKLDKLLCEGLITGFEWRVAGWLRSCYERGYGSDLRSTLPQLGMAGRTTKRLEDPAARRAAARQYLRHIERELGQVVYGILVNVVVDDWCWAKLGRRLGRDPKTARSWAIEAIKVLATV